MTQVTPVLHAAVAGPDDGLPVVLLHSICTNMEVWQPQLPVWNEMFRTIRVDLPGHGKSPALGGTPTLRDFARSVAATLDALQISRAALVGISLGSMVAQAFALEVPERVAGLVLAHAGARTSPEVRELWNQRLAQLEEQGLEQHVRGTLERWFTVGFAGNSPLTVAWVEKMIRATPVSGYREAVSAIQGLDHLARLGAIDIPALVIAGAEDKAVPPAAAAVVANEVPGAAISLLAAAHMSSIERPVEFTELAGRFLASLGNY